MPQGPGGAQRTISSHSSQIFTIASRSHGTSACSAICEPGLASSRRLTTARACQRRTRT
ncbi:hypothetical protein [[Actinomadura] parvosata]|uniref:hypothetical protein n=1 Tax=[Actinomadura] parvosata TaxID=1955412 RepID=UPI001646FCA3